MPELPEVETVCRGLAQRLTGRRLVRVLVRRDGLRLPFPQGMALMLTGRVIISIRRRAKYILVHLDDGAVVIAHLGMSGRIIVVDAPLPELSRHDHVVMETDDGAVVTFNDARRFGLMVMTTAVELDTHPLLAELGPEPLSPQFTPACLSLRLAGRKTSIKTVLLDQTVVAGLGNIYVSEALFHAGISPLRQARMVAGPGAGLLVSAIRRVLTAAIAAGGSSLRDYVQPSGELGYFQHSFAVYDREGAPCPGCVCDVVATGGVLRMSQAGRSTYYCPRRQE
ncbi:MAG: bifunctional DNA-formamidopyrimidine glycosylase/DNA-(apurinic or apyrimidinic site) lyase [Rhodospirillaceae bacterium]